MSKNTEHTIKYPNRFSDSYRFLSSVHKREWNFYGLQRHSNFYTSKYRFLKHTSIAFIKENSSMILIFYNVWKTNS